MSTDIWHRWLLDRRFGGDSRQMQRMMDFLTPIRDAVLRNADLHDGDTLLDVGCGDGLIAFGALNTTPVERVIFSDISQDLLEHVQQIVQETEFADRCAFLRASADDINLPNESVEAVTTRSVLIYVKAKQAAFNEFYRVLKPEGRLSIFEPINRFGYPEPAHVFSGYDVTPVEAIAAKIKALYAQLQPIDSDPMLDFDERDLIALAQRAGFREVHLDYQVTIKPKSDDMDWDVMLRIPGNPKIPSLEEAMQQALTAEERKVFIAHLRPMVEEKRGSVRNALAYLYATK
ncbi:MAG: methyltransferase domain-containing protein [Anaerolineae bacterium]|nr:methyltransferase domain-containing protein [Anaerolineae bacterium]